VESDTLLLKSKHACDNKLLLKSHVRSLSLKQKGSVSSLLVPVYGEYVPFIRMTRECEFCSRIHTMQEG
jgi:hypothetical protein